MAAAPSLDVVLFDIDDTLYSTTAFAHDARRAAVAAMIHHGLQVSEEEGNRELAEVVAEFTSNYDEHLDRLLDRLGPTRWGGRNPAVLIAAGVVAYHQTKERHLRPLPDAIVLLRSLHQAGVRTGIVSAGLRVKQAEKLVRLGVLPWLDPGAIFFSDQMGVSKPNPKIYAKACEALRVPPARTMYVGDRPETDVAPARAVGLRTVHYRGAHGRYSDSPARPPADHEVELLTDLKPVLRESYGLPV
ncbi:MAG: HAD-IA family hydrolase [Planctomycetes bacterium]|nr:HAD-IA family hydrolase [Planctomycetota bacterium]